eukprot:502851_1
MDKQSLSVKSIFKHAYDHQSFISLYKNIKNSALCINLKAPTEIIQQIAEYGNGYVLNCSNEDCNKHQTEIFKLQSEFDPLGYGMTVGKWYCRNCQFKLKYFACVDEWKMSLKKQTNFIKRKEKFHKQYDGYAKLNINVSGNIATVPKGNHGCSGRAYGSVSINFAVDCIYEWKMKIIEMGLNRDCIRFGIAGLCCCGMFMCLTGSAACQWLKEKILISLGDLITMRLCIQSRTLRFYINGIQKGGFNGLGGNFNFSDVYMLVEIFGHATVQLMSFQQIPTT